ncbi:nicotinamide phosphoribosyltransferase domain-containing protein, partial [Bacillus thuringiensis]|nr:nicotinamide phosphoribosyltransferase domain-containing protein [Bacillus thuringiensis]
LPMLLCDYYKTSHIDQYPEGTEVIYSTFTPRSNRYMPYADKVVVFGIQSFVKKYLVDYFDEHFFSRPLEDVVAEYVRYMKHTLFIEEPKAAHIIELHKLGYMPLQVKALPEGTLAPIKVPVLTVENTRPDLVSTFWITNYLETIMSNEIWLPMTSATVSYQYRKLLIDMAMKTVGHANDVPFQAHDFSMRGMSSLESAMASGAGHLLSFVGTDTVPAIAYLEHYYNANIEKELVGTSIPATEHSVMSANTDADSRDEFEMYKRLITEVYPKGFFSVVSDTYD